MTAEADHPGLTARPLPLRLPKSAHSCCLPGLWAQLHLSSPVPTPPGEVRERQAAFLGSWKAGGAAAPRARPALPRGRSCSTMERGARPPPPGPSGTAASRDSGRGQRAGHGGLSSSSEQEHSLYSRSSRRLTPWKPTQDGCRAVVLASGGFSTKCPLLRLRRSLGLAAVCISDWLVDSHQTNA